MAEDEEEGSEHLALSPLHAEPSFFEQEWLSCVGGDRADDSVEGLKAVAEFNSSFDDIWKSIDPQMLSKAGTPPRSTPAATSADSNDALDSMVAPSSVETTHHSYDFRNHYSHAVAATAPQSPYFVPSIEPPNAPLIPQHETFYAPSPLRNQLYTHRRSVSEPPGMFIPPHQPDMTNSHDFKAAQGATPIFTRQGHMIGTPTPPPLEQSTRRMKPLPRGRPMNKVQPYTMTRARPRERASSPEPRERFERAQTQSPPPMRGVAPTSAPVVPGMVSRSPPPPMICAPGTPMMYASQAMRSAPPVISSERVASSGQTPLGYTALANAEVSMRQKKTVAMLDVEELRNIITEVVAEALNRSKRKRPATEDDEEVVIVDGPTGKDEQPVKKTK